MAANDIVIRIIVDNAQGAKLKQASAQVQQFQTEAKASTKDLGTNIFRFRDGVNATVNSVAVLFRRLARLRTAFFILVNILALRQVVRLFEELTTHSADLQQRLGEIGSKFDVIKGKIADTAAPAFEAFVKLKDTFQLDLFKFFARNASAFGQMVEGFGVIYSLAVGIKDLVYAIVLAFKALPSILKVGFQSIWEDLKSIPARLAESFLVTLMGIFEKIKAATKGKFGLGWISDTSGAIAESLVPAFNEASAAVFEFDQKTKSLQESLNLVPEVVAARKALDELISNFNSGQYTNAPQSFIDLADALRDLEKRAKALQGLTPDKISGFQEAWKGFFDGLKGQVRTIKDLAADMGRAFREAFQSGLSDTFVALMEGRLNKIKDAVVSTLESIKRAIANFLAEKVVKDIISGIGSSAIGKGISSLIFGGGNTAGFDPAGPAQYGGIAGFRQERVVGEAGPEAIVPLKHGAIPVAMSGMPRAQRSTPSVVNNITFSPQVIDGPSFSSWLNKEKNTVKRIMVEAAVGGDMAVRSAFKVSR